MMQQKHDRGLAESGYMQRSQLVQDIAAELMVLEARIQTLLNGSVETPKEVSKREEGSNFSPLSLIVPPGTSSLTTRSDSRVDMGAGNAPIGELPCLRSPHEDVGQAIRSTTSE
jgi:hypothetical protein